MWGPCFQQILSTVKAKLFIWCWWEHTGWNPDPTEINDKTPIDLSGARISLSVHCYPTSVVEMEEGWLALCILYAFYHVAPSCCSSPHRFSSISCLTLEICKPSVVWVLSSDNKDTQHFNMAFPLRIWEWVTKEIKDNYHHFTDGETDTHAGEAISNGHTMIQ